MPRLPLPLARLLLCGLVSLPLAPIQAQVRPQSPPPQEVVFVNRGHSIATLGAWVPGPSALQGEGRGNGLWAKQAIGTGDFHVRANLRFSPGADRGRFVLGPNVFYFMDRPHLQGPLNPSNADLGPVPNLFTPGPWHFFEAIQQGDSLHILMNGTPIYQTASPPQPYDRLGLLPGTGTLQVQYFSLIGQVVPLPQPNRYRVMIPTIDWTTHILPAAVGTMPGQVAPPADEMKHAAALPDVDTLAQATRPTGADIAPLAPTLIPVRDGQQLAFFTDRSGLYTTLLTATVGGTSWSPLSESPAALSGDAMVPHVLPDGRLLVIFRDLEPASTTYGDVVGWVGRHQDLVGGAEGAFRVRLFPATRIAADTLALHLAEAPDGNLTVTAYTQQQGDSLAVVQQASFTMAALDARVPTPGFILPIIDLDDEAERQVVVDREPGQYLGHPTTALLGDGRTLIAVYPKGHGKGAIVMKRSTDGGQTWSARLPTPANWETSQEVPTLFRVPTPAGGHRLIMFSGLYPIRIAHSDDDGATWSPLSPIGNFGGIVAMSSVVPLANGNLMALFHDDGRFIRAGGLRTDRFTVYKTLSSDGGRSWSPPIAIATHPTAHLCEPGAVRSPDGEQIAVLLRENSRQHNSFIMFSDDEGQTWSRPRELPASLTGDRHVGRYGPDGRLFLSFRDTAHESPTQGDWVGWVGTYEDLWEGRPGQYRVRFKDNHHQWDTAYPGVEVLPDGTFVVTTYGHWAAGEEPYILSVRFMLDELDEKATNLQR